MLCLSADMVSNLYATMAAQWLFQQPIRSVIRIMGMRLDRAPKIRDH